MHSRAKLIKAAMHAGSWYTSNPQELDQELTTNLAAAKAKIQASEQKKLKALIGPHAGLRWSGPNAAWAYVNIQDPNQYDTIFILGPSHKVYLDFVATTNCTHWQTPIGDLTVDHDIVDKLVGASNLEKGGKIQFERIDKKFEENEHSLEMHTPYVRKMFASRLNTDKDIKIVPLMVGQLPADDYREYAKTLVPYFKDERTLFCISSDFCHWGQRFKYQHKFDEFQEEEIFKSIEKLDHESFNHICNHSLNDFQGYLTQTKNTICGRCPI